MTGGTGAAIRIPCAVPPAAPFLSSAKERGERPLRLPCGAMWASRPTDILRAGAAGPMWAAAPTERLTVDVRKGRPPWRPEPGLHRCSCKPVIASRWASWSQ